MGRSPLTIVLFSSNKFSFGLGWVSKVDFVLHNINPLRKFHGAASSCELIYAPQHAIPFFHIGEKYKTTKYVITGVTEGLDTFDASGMKKISGGQWSRIDVPPPSPTSVNLSLWSNSIDI